MSRSLAILIPLFNIAFPSVGAAQHLWPVSAEISVGRTTGSTSGEYRSNDTGLALDVLAGARVGQLPQGSLFAAVGLALQGTGPVTDICLPASRGGCIPRFPQFCIASILAGWETDDGAARVLAGPAYAWADRAAPGLQAHGSLFLIHTWRLAVGVTIRGLILPVYDGDSFQLLAGGVTVRVR